LTFEKKGYVFNTWQTFYSFLDSQTTGGLFGSGESANIKAAMVKVNFDPNVHLKKSNPDACLYQSINKTELKTYSTEFCFFPLGSFEITSLGQLWDPQGNIISEHKSYSIATIYDFIYHTSQYDFEGGPDGFFVNTPLITSYTELPDNDAKAFLVYNTNNLEARTVDTAQKILFRKAKDDINQSPNGLGFYSFSSGNNLFQNYPLPKDLWTKSSKLFGHLVPLDYNMETGLENENSNDPDYCFQLDFSNRSNPIMEDVSQNLAYPNPDITGIVDNNSNPSSVHSDGYVFSPSIDTLCCEINTNNFPNISEEGLILFWFKISNDWCQLDNTWHTVFFSNQTYRNGGILREIQFQVTGPKDDKSKNNHDLFLRNINIRFHNRVYGEIDEEFLKEMMSEDKITPPFSFPKETCREMYLKSNYNLGIHTNNWYHLTVRFHQGIFLNDFSDDTDVSMVLCGDFYGDPTYSVETKQYKYEKNKDRHKVRDDLILPEENDSYVVGFSPVEFNQTEIFPGGSPSNSTGGSTDNSTGNSTGGSSSTPPSIILTPISNVQQNNFCIGGIYKPTKTFTIDDFRIKKPDTNTISIAHADYLPMRFPKIEFMDFKQDVILRRSAGDDDDTYDESDLALFCYGAFQGRIKGHNRNGCVTSFTWTPRMVYDLQPGDPKQASMQERTININGKEYLEREIRRLFQKFLGEISKNFKPEGIEKKKYDVFKEMDKHQWQAEITVFTKYKDKKIDLEEMIKNIENLVNTQENDLENGQGNGWGNSLGIIDLEKLKEIQKVLCLKYMPKNNSAKEKGLKTGIICTQKENEEAILAIPKNKGNIESYDKYSLLSNHAYPDSSSTNEWAVTKDDKWHYNNYYSTKETYYSLAELILHMNTYFKEKIEEPEEQATDFTYLTVSTETVTPTGEPYIIDASNDYRFVYALVFPALKNSKAIFNSPAVDDVTVIYTLDNYFYNDYE